MKGIRINMIKSWECKKAACAMLLIFSCVSMCVNNVSAQEVKKNVDNISYDVNNGIEEPVKGNGADLEQMYQRATYCPQADMTRLANTIRKAMNGEEITIGFIGGSITEGYSASKKENSYAALVYKWWCEKFPDTKINYVNAGIGGTSSYLAVHRAQEELLKYDPDLVFIEFAVNDSYTEHNMNSYESLVRKVLNDEKSPAVVLLFSTNALGDGVQAVEQAIGTYYQLPMISYRDAVIPEILAGNFVWTDISPDIVHPNDLGHSIYAGLITRYLEETAIKLNRIPKVTKWKMPEKIGIDRYENAHIENAATIQPIEMQGFGHENVNYHFGYNWKAVTDDASITFVVDSANIGVIYQRTIDGSSGQYDVYIDGEYVKTLDGNFVEGYGTETDVSVLHADELNQHKQHIVKIVKNPDSENNKFTIIGLLLS